MNGGVQACLSACFVHTEQRIVTSAKLLAYRRLKLLSQPSCYLVSHRFNVSVKFYLLVTAQSIMVEFISLSPEPSCISIKLSHSLKTSDLKVQWIRIFSGQHFTAAFILMIQ